MMPVRSSLRSIVCCAALLVGVTLGPGLVRAQPPTEVAVITPDPGAPIAIRIAKELNQLGLQVVFVREQPGDAPGPRSLEAAAQGVGAFAAVRVVHTGAAVEVWIADRTTGKTVIRDVVGAGQGGSDGDVALGAVELLRASLLELQVTEQPHGEVAASPAVLELVPSPAPAPPTLAPPPAPSPAGRELVTVALGVAVDPGIGGFRVGYGPTVLIGRRFTEVVGAEATGGVVFGEVAEDPRGRATVTATHGGVGVVVGPRLGRALPIVGAGLGVAHVATQGALATGVPASELAARQVAAWLATPYLRGGVGVELHPALRWRVDGTLFAALGAATVRFDGDPVATWGRPTLLVATSLELVVR